MTCSDENSDMPVDAIMDGARPRTVPSDTPTTDTAGDKSLSRLSRWVEARAMFVIAVSLVVVIGLVSVPSHLGQDGWLALVGGRQIAAHGIPSHDYFAHMTQGALWVDQQWLAQLLMYELARLGGLQLMTVVYVLMTGAAFAGAIAAARALGAEDLHVLMATLPGAFFYLVTAVSIRTQGFAYPLFLAELWLLASEVRSQRRSSRAYLVFPMLVVWANLHGSVTLGAGLAVLYGLLELAGSVRSGGAAGLADPRAWLFVVISPLTLLATPYGFGVMHYYTSTLTNPNFSRIVTEWKPITSVPILAVLLLVLIALTAVVAITVTLRGRAGQATVGRTGTWQLTVPALPPLFDALTLLVLAIGAVMAVRNVTWFGLALLVLLPTLLSQLKRRVAPLRRARVNMIMATLAALIASVVTLVVVTRPTAWFSRTYPSRAIPTLRRLIASDPRGRVLADVRFADWLIWEDPRLFSGRVAYDTSFELLSRSQLVAIGDLAADTGNARKTVGAYRIWMLYPVNHSMNRILLHRPGVRVVTRTHRVIIALNTRGGTA